MRAEVEAGASGEYVWPTSVAWAYAALGDRDRAFAYLERAYADGAAWLPLAACAPAFDPLRGDPRLDALIRRVGATPPGAAGVSPGR